MIEIKLSIDHRYFKEPLGVWLTWDFPFLPRVGEYICPWVWIEENTFSDENLKSELSPEGLKNLLQWDGRLTGGLGGWLYEMGIDGGNKINRVSYEQKKEDGSLYVSMYVGQ